MRKTVIALTLVSALLFSLAVGILSVGAAENSWTTKAPMYTARGGAGVATVNGIIYAIGGQHNKTLVTPNSLR
jgi:hypothetical protein